MVIIPFFLFIIQRSNKLPIKYIFFEDGKTYINGHNSFPIIV